MMGDFDLRRRKPARRAFRSLLTSPWLIGTTGLGLIVVEVSVEASVVASVVVEWIEVVEEIEEIGVWIVVAAMKLLIPPTNP
jgi:hypothetical protein